MAPFFPLTLDELLTTTRAVRTRLDLRRPVEREVVLECLAIAQQAPTASNRQNWHFMVVTDAEKRAALAELYRKGGNTTWRCPSRLPISPSPIPPIWRCRPVSWRLSRPSSRISMKSPLCHPLPLRAVRGATSTHTKCHVGDDCASRMEFHVGRPRSWARDGLDISTSSVRRGRPRARHRVCGSYASMPYPGGLRRARISSRDGGNLWTPLSIGRHGKERGRRKRDGPRQAHAGGLVTSVEHPVPRRGDWT